MAAILAIQAACGSEAPPAAPRALGDEIEVSSIAVTPEAVEVRPGESTTLSATALDADGNPVADVQIEWRSSDPAVASVSADGTLTAHQPGVVTITAEISEETGELSGEAAVSVLAPVAAVEVVTATIDLRRGRLAFFRARLTDDQGNELLGRSIAWASSDPLIASVDSSGRVEGLADGQATIRATSEGVTGSVTVRVEPGGFLAVSAGMGHSCAIAVDGSGWCWGANEHGQLGSGDKIPSSSPRPVAGGLTFSSIAAGAGYTCAVTPSGEGYCWGDNSMMELGNRQAGKTSPVPVPVLSAPPFAVVGGASNMAHSCFLTTAQEAYCWGYNRFGMVGNGSVQDEPYPLSVVGGLFYSSLSAAHMRTCAVATDGTAYCWGRGGRLQVGNANASIDTCDGFECSMSPRRVSGSRRYASISTGRMHTCAIAVDERLFCWGDNGNGQVGDGTFADATAPTQIAGGGRFAHVSAGDSHSCGVLEDGQAMCWGYNADGRLGSGTMTASPVPIALAGSYRFVAVSAGYTHTCGVVVDGAVLCWGDNMMGQLGDGTTVGRVSPVAVREP